MGRGKNVNKRLEARKLGSLQEHAPLLLKGLRVETMRLNG